MKTTENERLDQLLSELKSRTPQPDIDAWLTEDESEAYDRIIVIRQRRRRIVRWAAAAVLVVGCLLFKGIVSSPIPSQKETVSTTIAPTSTPQREEVVYTANVKIASETKKDEPSSIVHNTPKKIVATPLPQEGEEAALSDLYSTIDAMTDQALRDAERLTMEQLSRLVAAEQPS